MSYQITSHKYLNKQEFQYLIERLENDWSTEGLLIKLAIQTGARAQELLNLTHYDLLDNKPRVLISGLKGSNDREIPIEKSLFNALKALPLNETLFNIHIRTLQRIWANYTPNPRKSFKSIRHSSAIYTFKKHKDIMLVKLMLGHRSLTNTQVYLEHLYANNELERLIK